MTKPKPRQRCSWAIWDASSGKVRACGRTRTYRDQSIPAGCKLWVSRSRGVTIDTVFDISTGQPVEVSSASR